MARRNSAAPVEGVERKSPVSRSKMVRRINFAHVVKGKNSVAVELATKSMNHDFSSVGSTVTVPLGAVKGRSMSQTK